VGANWVEFRAVNKLGEPHHARTTAIDIQNFINERPFITFQKIVLALCFLVVAADGFDTAAIGFIGLAIAAIPALIAAISIFLKGRVQGSVPRGKLGVQRTSLAKGSTE